MKLLVSVALVCLCGLCWTQAQAQTEEIGFASIKNMIEAVVPQIVTSITQTDPQIHTIAIWNLDSGVDQKIDMTFLEDRLTSGLVAANQFKRFVVIDRPGLQLLAAEKQLQLVEIVDRKRMREVGQALEIDAFLYGSVSLQANSFVLELKLMDPSRAAIVWGETFEARDPVREAKNQRAIEEAERNLRMQKLSKERKSEASAAFRSLILPGLGQFYASRNSEGISFLFVEGIAGSLILVSAIENSGDDNNLVTIGTALIVANHLVSTIHAAIAANRYNTNLEKRLSEGVQISWKPETQQLGLRYTHRF